MKPDFQYYFCTGNLLLFLCATTLAQDDFNNSVGQQEATEVDRRAQKKYIIKLDAPLPARIYCQSSIAFDYLQKNTAAIVNMTLENLDCAASSGSYTVAVRIRDDNNESRTIEYEETWQREDDQSLAHRQEYLIGDNVDLINVRIKKPKCVCTEMMDNENDASRNTRESTPE